MHGYLNFSEIIRDAWRQYDPSRKVRNVVDISAMVSTNHVFRVKFFDGGFVIAKCSFYGKFRHFKEDHTIIHELSDSLRPPFDHFLARSLMKDGEVYTYSYKQGLLDAWVIFYNPISIDLRLPRQLDEFQIRRLGNQLAHFHLACFEVRDALPPSSKTLASDMQELKKGLENGSIILEPPLEAKAIVEQCELFLTNSDRLGANEFPSIPVFVDWNIGNFSVTSDVSFYSRWDYDWFRMSSRIMDFYFFARVSSSVGDRTTFSYLADPMMEERFGWFLDDYHKIYPLTKEEVFFMKEAYRFFILNYVIKDGQHFFHQIYASRLRKEAVQTYFPELESKFDAEKILGNLTL